MTQAQIGRHVLKIPHRADIDPGLRNGDNDIGMAKAQRRHQLDGLVGLRDLLAHEVLARHAQMRRAGRQMRDDVGSRQEQDLDIVHAREPGAIIARASGLDHGQACALEEGGRIFLKPPLGWHGDDERRGARRRGCLPFGEGQAWRR